MDTYDQAWLENWAASKTYDGNSGNASWLVISEVLSFFPDHAVKLNSVDLKEGSYSINLDGPVLNNVTVYLNP
jgi:hypothetical protein